MADTPSAPALQRFRNLAIFMVLIWAIHLVNVVSGDALLHFALVPRQLDGLDGIIGAPLLHASFAHLFSNSVGLVLLGGLVCMHSASAFVRVTVFVALLGGLATWLFARHGYHVGASGLIFGYFGYLVTRGLVEKTAKGLVIALLVVAAYSGLLWGVLPSHQGVSWEGHLFGFLAGILAARWRIHSEIPRA